MHKTSKSPDESPLPFFVAFYSYKGGVGRSLALANVGYALASRGKRVVLIDMDLEAPGLHDIPELALRGSGAKKGFLEYAASYRRTGKCPAIGRYVHECREHPGAGKLWMMPAGSLGEGYQTELGHLPWRKLHPRTGTEPFLEGLRSALAKEFRPDYVLIDARTGLSDVGGLSTHRLADMVVLVFNLTRACLEGSVRAYRSFTAGGSRVHFVQLLASPVPPQAPEPTSAVERRLAQVAELMPLGVAYGRSLIRVDYHPAMVLAEELAVLRPDSYPAASRYEALRESIQRANPREVFLVLEEAWELRAAGRLREGLALLRAFTEEHPGSTEGHLELGNLLLEAGRAKDALGPFRRACETAPDLGLSTQRLGEALVAAGRADDAISVLRRAEELGQNGPDVYLALARACAEKGDASQEIEARRKAMKAMLRELVAEKSPQPTPYALPELRSKFVDVLGRRPPFSGFEPLAFWDSVMGALSMTPAEKLEMLQGLLAGSMRPNEIARLSRNLQEEESRWEHLFGPSAREFQRRVAATGVDTFDPDALMRLRKGDSSDAAMLGFLALDEKNTLDRRISLLEEALALEPENQALMTALGTALVRVAQSQPVTERKDLLRRAVDLLVPTRD